MAASTDVLKGSTRPFVATMIGDPNGIGPEVVVKAWSSGEAHKVSRPVLIGSVPAVELAVEMTGVHAKVRKIAAPHEISDDPGIIDVIDRGELPPAALTPGKSNPECGLATALWLDYANELLDKGELGAMTYAPIDTVAMKAAGVVDRVVNIEPGKFYALLVSGALRVAHLTDHMLLRDVCRIISADLVEAALTEIDRSLRAWGVPNPRIIVAGLNPHAQGPEEKEAIAPGVARARVKGINATGPDSPDAVFRQCIEGQYDVVLAMYHDQGHIPIKTWGFSGNCVLVLGQPHIQLSVAHGTAHDIVGRNIADPAMMLSAMMMAGNLAAGAGFPKQ